MTEGANIEALAVEYGQALVDHAYLVCRDPELAQDVVQGVLTRLASTGLPDDVHNASGYFRRAVSNEILSVYRRHKRFRVLAPLLLEHRAQSDPADDVAAQFTLWGAFDVLSPRQRVAVVLRYYHDFSDEEIAAELACAPATVRTLLSRALKRLRTRLEGAGDA